MPPPPPLASNTINSQFTLDSMTQNDNGILHTRYVICVFPATWYVIPGTRYLTGQKVCTEQPYVYTRFSAVHTSSISCGRIES